MAFPASAAAAALAADRGSVESAKRAFKSTLAANFTRKHRAQRLGLLDHLLRSLPGSDVHVQRRRRSAEETRGGWYVRQLLGSANIDGGPLFHLLAGNLSFQL